MRTESIEPVSRKACEHGDDGVQCPNKARQYHRGRPICGKHANRLRRNGRVGGGGTALLGKRVKKHANERDANRKQQNKERDAGQRLSQVVRATGWRHAVVVLNRPSGHGRRVYSDEGASRISRMMLTSWIGRGWVVNEGERLRLTKQGAAMAARWKS